MCSQSSFFKSTSIQFKTKEVCDKKCSEVQL